MKSKMRRMFHSEENRVLKTCETLHFFTIVLIVIEVVLLILTFWLRL